MKVSLLMPVFRRPQLLNIGLASIRHFKPTVDFEILVLNDGIEDGTKEICDKYADLNVRYIFTGKRNVADIKPRVPGFALNIGIKQALGDIIILTGAEIYHLNNATDIVTKAVIDTPSSMVTPEVVLFDNDNNITKDLLLKKEYNPNIDRNLLLGGEFGKGHGIMPYFLGIMKKHLIDINGYDEDFTGYACEDSDLIGRLSDNKISYNRVPAEVIHLFHTGTNDGTAHWDNPEWVKNYNLLLTRSGILKRNKNKEWGVL